MTDGFDLDEELREGVALWEAGWYVEAHEAFEQLWLTEVGPRRHFLRGLIHAAMGFHYVTVGDTVSAWSKLNSAGSLLQGFTSDFLGMNVDGLRDGIAAARTVLEAARDATPVTLRCILIPRLTLESGSAAVRETEP
jgi:predicted metal-dependent hydrolase